jgi:drug/metabolite transporter (DMT)-like permease
MPAPRVKMMKQQSLLEIHVAVLLFGLAGLFGKWLPLHPAVIVLGRVFFASLTLALLLGMIRQRLSITPKRDYFIFAGMGLILALHWVVFFKSIQVSTVAVGLLSCSSFPVFTAFLEPLFFKDRMDRVNLFFALICVFGVFLIIPTFNLADTTFQGVLWGLLAGGTFAILTILNRKFSQKYSSLLIAFFQDFFATVFLLPFYFALRPGLSMRSLFLLIILGVLCTAGSHTLFIKGMRQIRAQPASIISSLEPVYGIGLALLFLREVPTLRTILGGIVILGAVVFISIKARSR